MHQEKIKQNKRKSLLWEWSAEYALHITFWLFFTSFFGSNRLFLLHVIDYAGHRRYEKKMIQHSTWAHCSRSFGARGGIECYEIFFFIFNRLGWYRKFNGTRVTPNSGHKIDQNIPLTINTEETRPFWITISSE